MSKLDQPTSEHKGTVKKLDIVYEIIHPMTKQRQFVLKMQNCTFELHNFQLLHHQEQFLNPDNIPKNGETCHHEFIFVANCQTRASDEAFTSIYICQKCNYEKCIS